MGSPRSHSATGHREAESPAVDSPPSSGTQLNPESASSSAGHHGIPLRPALSDRKSTKALIQEYENAIDNTGAAHPHSFSAHPSPATTTTVKRVAPPTTATRHSETSAVIPSSSAPSTATKRDKSPLRHSFRNLLTLLKEKKDKFTAVGPVIGDTKSTPSPLSKSAKSATKLQKNLPLPPHSTAANGGPPLLSRSPSQTGTLIYLISANDAGASVKSTPIWTTSTILLRDGKITVSWFAEDAASRSMAPREISLDGCTNIRSITLGALDPATVDALSNWEGLSSAPTTGKKEEEESDLKLFEILFERRAREVFAVRSVREREKWISAFWDAILPEDKNFGRVVEHRDERRRARFFEPDSDGEEEGEIDSPSPLRMKEGGGKHLSAPIVGVSTDTIPPVLTKRERSLPPLPSSRLNSTSSFRSRFLEGPTAPSEAEVAGDTAPRDAGSARRLVVVNAPDKEKYTSMDRAANLSAKSVYSIPDLPLPIKLQPHPTSRSRSASGARSLRVKDNLSSSGSRLGSPGGSTLSYTSAESGTTGSSQVISASTGPARRGRPASPSVRNLSTLSVVKQRLAAIERNASQDVVPLEARGSNGREKDRDLRLPFVSGLPREDGNGTSSHHQRDLNDDPLREVVDGVQRIKSVLGVGTTAIEAQSTIHQIALGLDHRLTSTNHVLKQVKDKLESMERQIVSAGSAPMLRKANEPPAPLASRPSVKRSSSNSGAIASHSRIPLKRAGSTSIRNAGLDASSEVRGLLNEIKTQLDSGLPELRTRIMELKLASDHKDGGRVSGDHDLAQTMKVDLDLIPLQAKVDELLTLVSANQPDGAAANHKLQEEVTAIVSILEDDVGHRECQARQQADSVRYLNELNKWLETFVNNGTSQIQVLAENIQRLCSELGADLNSDSRQETPSKQPRLVGPATPGTTNLLNNVRQLVLGMKARDASMASLQASVNDLITLLNAETRVDSQTLVQMLEAQKRDQEMMIKAFSNEISGEIKGERLRFVEAMKEATAINVHQHVEHFRKELSRQVHTQARELERLQQEKQNVEHQIADLFAFYSKQKASLGRASIANPQALLAGNPYLSRVHASDVKPPKAAKGMSINVAKTNSARSHRYSYADENYSYKAGTAVPLPYPIEPH